MTKLDELAKAIYEARTASRRALNSTTWVSGYDELPDDAKHYERLGARAALEALKPLDIWVAEQGRQQVLAYPPCWEDFADGFQAAIDAILSEGEGR